MAMIMLLALVATVATPLPIPPELGRDIACVVTVARAAPSDKTLDVPGREYAAIVGAEIMDTTGRTREQARDLFAQALRVPESGSDLATCTSRMAAKLLDGKLPEPAK